MSETRLFHIYTRTDRDQAFWEEHLEGWLPKHIIDAHVHVQHPRFQIETLSEELKRSYWVMELSDTQDAETAERCYRALFPGPRGLVPLLPHRRASARRSKGRISIPPPKRTRAAGTASSSLAPRGSRSRSNGGSTTPAFSASSPITA